MVESLILVILMELHFMLSLHIRMTERVYCLTIIFSEPETIKYSMLLKNKNTSKYLHARIFLVTPG